MRTFTTASTRVNSSPVIGRGWLTSKRSRSGAFRLPFCVTVRAEFTAQYLVQQMRGGVMRANAGAARVIDGGDNGVVDPDGAAFDDAEMHEQIAQFLLGIGDADVEAGSGDDLLKCVAEHDYCSPWSSSALVLE